LLNVQDSGFTQSLFTTQPWAAVLGVAEFDEQPFDAKIPPEKTEKMNKQVPRERCMTVFIITDARCLVAPNQNKRA
jgi:hypothetical protein